MHTLNTVYRPIIGYSLNECKSDIVTGHRCQRCGIIVILSYGLDWEGARTRKNIFILFTHR
jgi:hypothetical protein